MITGYIKRPGEDPERGKIDPSLKWMTKTLDGPVGAVQVKLTSGTEISIMVNSSAAFFALPYNFTVCPTIDKRTWIDIVGPCVIVGRDAAANMVSVDLDEKEIAELISYPYEV